MSETLKPCRDLSRVTLRHNIETILRKYRDVHPSSMLEKIMTAIPVGAYPPGEDKPHPFADALKTLEQHYYTDEELARWLVAPQALMNGQTPLQMLAAGRKAEVLACIQRLDDGVYL